MAAAKKPHTRWFDGTTPLEELEAPEAVAHEIVLARADLTVSVVRIMDAEIEEDQRLVALEAFRDSLDDPGNPNRDPRVAIANAS